MKYFWVQLANRIYRATRLVIHPDVLEAAIYLIIGGAVIGLSCYLKTIGAI